MFLYSKLGYFIGILILLQFSFVTTNKNDDDVFIPYEGQRYDNFDWDILKRFDVPDSGNVVISPLSVKLLMAILYEGLRDPGTKQEIERFFNFNRNVTIARTRFATILNSLKASADSYELNIASKVYLDSTYTYKDSYRNKIKRYYNADAEQINFNQTTTSCNKINDWVSNATAGKISNMVQDDDVQQTILLLLNAIFFKGQWLNQFPKNQTTTGGFYLTSQQSVTVKYMINTGKYYYVESSDLDAKILRIPYKAPHIAMFLVLPNSKAGLRRLIKNINPGVLNKNLWLMDSVNVEVILPKFQFQYKALFAKVLQKMGLQKIFDNTADYGNLVKGGKERIFVSNILQKAGIEVNEEGSAAFATTEIVLGNKFGSPDHLFNASNPFLFYIEDTRTGTILFAGKIENPIQAETLVLSEIPSIPNRFGETTEDEDTVAPISLGNAQTNLNPTDSRNTLNYGKFHYFDMELLKAVASRSNGNVIISPTSVKQVLAMVLEGADGKCAEELRNALRLPHNQKQIRELFETILQGFTSEAEVTFETANHIFISDAVTPLKQYEENLRDYYHSGVRRVNFATPVKTSNLINSWINDVTHGLIPTLVTPDSLNAETSIILANALYFKGLWEKSFMEEKTRVACFQHVDNECYKTYMMDSSETYNFADIKELDVKAIEIPYKDGKYSMLIILPNKMSGITRMLRDLPYEYDKIINKLESTEVLVTIPRFSFEYSEDIARHLEELDITEIFSEQKANLSHIIQGKRNLFISNVFHKAKIEVNEKGTIAAASTGAVVIPLMGSTKPRFRADHPFVFLIRHVKLGTVLFAGRVTEPEPAQENNQNYGSNHDQDRVQENNNKRYQEPPPLYNNFNQERQQIYTQEYTSQNVQNQQYSQQAKIPERNPSRPVVQQSNRFTNPQNNEDRIEYQTNENDDVITFPRKN